MEGESLIKKLKIVGISPETPNAATFTLQPLDHWQPTYEAGQFLTLVFTTMHGEKRRSYSISSSALLGEPLSITVKKQDNGEFSRYLLQYMKVGDEVLSSGVSGFFVLPKEKIFENYGFIAAGSGITPCFPIIKNILLKGSGKVLLIYSNKNKSDTIFLSQLEELQKKFANRFEIKFLFSDSNDVYSKRLSKWLLDQLLDRYLGEKAAETLFFMCGPFEYMQTVEIALRIRTGKENIIKENFSALPRKFTPAPPDTAMHQVTISYGNKIHPLKVQYPHTILAEAKKQGIVLPYSCESGRCGSCVATCTSGHIWMAYNEVLVDKELQNGRVLLCQAFPIGGDVEVRVE